MTVNSTNKPNCTRMQLVMRLETSHQTNRVGDTFVCKSCQEKTLSDHSSGVEVPSTYSIAFGRQDSSTTAVSSVCRVRAFESARPHGTLEYADAALRCCL